MAGDTFDDRTMLELMLTASIEAAAVINAVYARPFDTERKADGSPVTEADGAAEAIILKHLAPTGLPVLAEERASAGIIPELGSRYFVVDPLDGTKEFVKRNGEFTVNIALVENGRPTLGVVLVPVTGIAYLGGPDGAVRVDTSLGAPAERTALSVNADRPHRIVASRSHGHAALAQLCIRLEAGEDISVGSSLKFCLLAEGKAALYPRFTPTCEWDTAAGQAVLEAAGGSVVTLDGQALAYGKVADRFYNPYFAAAASPALARQMAQEMAALA
jgi:3'(2'), 5'-bisphosphate nucleotidase